MNEKRLCRSLTFDCKFPVVSSTSLPDAQEDDYLPCVKEMILLQRNFEKPHAAAHAICRQFNKPASKAKAKAKAKARHSFCKGMCLLKCMPGVNLSEGSGSIYRDE